MPTTLAKVRAEVGGLLARPYRVAPLAGFAARDGWRAMTEQRHIYRHSSEQLDSHQALAEVMEWEERAIRPDHGVAAYYSLLTGYAPSYPETTGYLIPTFYDYADVSGERHFREHAERMTRWLLTLQFPDGAFPGGFAEPPPSPSIFNSGQILQGLVRAWLETGSEAVRGAAIRCGDWLLAQQDADGKWSRNTYRAAPHSYYTMVAWSLAYLARETGEARFAEGARRNVDWVVSLQRPSGWFDGIALPTMFTHFVAYLIQGIVETAAHVGHDEGKAAASRAAWKLLRTFEVTKRLPGSWRDDWTPEGRYACLTGNAQMACVWLRLHELTGDIRWLNAAMKIDEMIKETLPRTGPDGVRGGVAGSFPIWGKYQTCRYINWGGKFFADALMAERRSQASLEGA